MSNSADTRTVSAPVEPGIHEFGAHLTFTDEDDGLSPFFAIAAQFDQALGNEETFEAAGDVWQFNHEEKKVKKWTGGLAGREEDSFDRFNEYQFGVVAVDDVGRKRVNLQFRPAFPEARHHETGDLIKSMPTDLPEGIRVQVQSANVEPEDVFDIIQGVADLLDINPDYFDREKLHPWSRVYDMALYVRLRREISEDHVVGEDGILERLALFTSRRRGRGMYEWDNEEILGHRTAVVNNTTNLEKLYRAHSVGKRLKAYHMKHPRKGVDPGEEPDDPTYHPKFEVQYTTDTDYTPPEMQSVPWSGDKASWFDRKMLRERLERHLLHALDWAGISLDPADAAYVEDQYWTPKPRADSLDIHPDPTEDLIEEERDLATHHFVNADLTEAQREVARVLANGGGHVDDVADEADVSRSTVYRVANRLDAIVQTIDGLVQFEDAVIKEKIQNILSVLDRQFDKLESRLRALGQRSRTRIPEDSALGRWADRYMARFDDDGGLELIIQLGELDDYEIVQIVRKAVRAAGQLSANTQKELLEGAVTWNDMDGNRRTARFGHFGHRFRFLGYNLRAQV